MVSTDESSRKIASVPLPWWTSQSRIATRRAPRASCAQRAATAVALRRQKPIGRAASAWCPGGRAITNALRSSPATTAATASSRPPTAYSAAVRVPGPIHASSSSSTVSCGSASTRSTWLASWTSSSAVRGALRAASRSTLRSTPEPSSARNVSASRSGRSNGGTFSHGGPLGGLRCPKQRSS